MKASIEATRDAQRPAQAMRVAAAAFRVRARWSVLMLAAGLLVTACASAPMPAPASERGMYRCDRNGDYEQRKACG